MEPVKNSRIDIRGVRQEQIVEAAVAVIAEQGIQNLSLSEIEKKAGMSRGQLTYYFPSKEDILLAVFDRLLQLIYQRVGEPQNKGCTELGGLVRVRHLLEKIVGQPPVSPEFHVLQYTFLSQIGHRDDFRRRLATLYEEWRSNLARDVGDEMARTSGSRKISPRALATLIQAILHGLTMQIAADPEAFDRDEMLSVCLDLLASYVSGGRRDRNGTRS